MIELINENAVATPENVNVNEFQGSDNNIVVIAPHPDDDVLGAGGRMKLHAEAEDNVFSVYLTTGSGTPAAGRRSPATIAKQRQAEAEKGLRAVGGVLGFFLQYESDDIREKRIDDVVQDLFRILIALKPKRIYLPSPFETHTTHLAAIQRTREAIQKVPEFTPELRGYGVWGTIFASPEEIENVDISEVIDTKKRAVRAHESEIKYLPYDTAIVGKDHSNAIFENPYEAGGASYIEKFLIMDELAGRPELELAVYSRNLALKHLHDMYTDLISTSNNEL